LESPTRVKISFTVDLKEVPTRISSLIRETASELEHESSELYECATSLNSSGSISHAIELVNRARIALMGADLRLEDCQTLLASYQATQAEISSEHVDTPPALPEIPPVEVE